jgi:Zinc finger C-x8-C-x5-C-x3-H type (and similar)
MHLILCLHLIESMRRLEIGDGGSNLPERPGEPDCVYYLRNGSCGYGDRCRYNHPRGSNLLVRKCIFIYYCLVGITHLFIHNVQINFQPH